MTTAGPSIPSALIDAHIRDGRGDRPAVIDGGRAISFRELQDRVRRMAAGLRTHGVAPGDRVLVALASGADAIAAFLAVQTAGAVAVMIPPTLRPRELAAIVADAEPRLAIAPAGFTAALAVASPETLLQSAPDAARVTAYGDPEATALIACTMGADGQPLGACHSAAAILASAEAYGRGVLGLSETDVVGGHPPLAFSYGLGALLVCPLLAGAATAPAPKFDAEALLGGIARDRVTVFFGTATCYRLLLRAPELMRRFDLRSLRLCVSAGEPLGAEVSRAWTATTGVDLIDGFGTTELYHMVISQRPGRVVHGALGRPVPGYQVRAVDSFLQPLPAGSEGALAVRGPTGARYWRRPDLQQTRVRDGWTLTGDVVVQDAGGLIWFRRRADGVIVSAGYNIAPREVEAVLEEHPAVRRAVVAGAPDPTRGAIVAARVALRPDAPPPSQELALALQQHVQRELSAFKCPRRIDFDQDL